MKVWFNRRWDWFRSSYQVSDLTGRLLLFAIPSAIVMDLSRFDAAPLIAFTAKKETNYGTETDGRIPPRCGADRVDQWANA